MDISGAATAGAPFQATQGLATGIIVLLFLIAGFACLIFALRALRQEPHHHRHHPHPYPHPRPKRRKDDR